MTVEGGIREIPLDRHNDDLILEPAAKEQRVTGGARCRQIGSVLPSAVCNKTDEPQEA